MHAMYTHMHYIYIYSLYIYTNHLHMYVYIHVYRIHSICMYISQLTECYRRKVESHLTGSTVAVCDCV